MASDMDLFQKRVASRDFYDKTFSAVPPLYQNQHRGLLYQRSQDFRTAMNLEAVSFDNRANDVMSQRLIEKFIDLPNMRDFLLWMKSSFIQSVNDDTSWDNIDTNIQHYPRFYTPWKPSKPGQYRMPPLNSNFYLSDKSSSHRRQSLELSKANVSRNGKTDLNGNANRTEYKSAISPDYSNVESGLGKYNYTFESFPCDTVEAPLRTENPGILTDKLKRKMLHDLQTRFIAERSKRKQRQDNHKDVIDLTADNCVEMPYDLSGKPAETDNGFTSNKVTEDDLIYFAPYDDYESDLDHIDENSIFAKHQRSYSNLLETKRLKTSHDSVRENGPFKKNQSHCDQSNVAKDSSELNKEMVVATSDREEAEREPDSQFRLNFDLNLNEISGQEEAIDYSMKLKSGGLVNTDYDDKNDDDDHPRKSVYFRNSSETKDNAPVAMDTSLKCLNSVTYACSTVTRNEGLNGNFDANASDVTNSASNRNSILKTLIIGSPHKNSHTSGKENSDVDTIAKLGFCIPFAQNKEVPLSEGKSGKTDERFRRLMNGCFSKMTERNDSDVVGNENRSLEELFDTIIANYMDSEDNC